MIHDRPYKRAMSHDARDRGAAPPRRHAVRPGARRALLRPVRRARARAGPDDPRHQCHAFPPPVSRSAGCRRRFDPRRLRPACGPPAEGGPGPDPRRRRSRPGRAWTWSVGNPRGDLDGCRGGRRSHGTARHVTRCRTARTRPNLRSPARHRLGLIVLRRSVGDGDPHGSTQLGRGRRAALAEEVRPGLDLPRTGGQSIDRVVEERLDEVIGRVVR